jgi:GNAT superfamily N-acetyltransferase
LVEEVRLIHRDELSDLLALYQYLNPDDPVLTETPDLLKIWDEILNDPSLYYLVSPIDGQLVASCTLAIVKNLTRSARPYGLIENVVTHPDYRKRGFGTAVLNKAVDICREQNCYKVMLMTGSKKESTLNFYDRAGFHRGEKTAYQIRL